MSLLRPPFPDIPSPALDMSPNAPPVFETLPVEVLGNILRQMASPEDLYSTIRASPKALGSFLWFREEVLIHVLQACLPAEIFAEFLGLLHAPKYEDLNYVPTQGQVQHAERWGATDEHGKLLAAWKVYRCDAWPEVVNCFFDRHFKIVGLAKSSNSHRYSIPDPANKREVNYLMSTYGMLKRFIRDYQLFVRINFTPSGSCLSDMDPRSSRRREAQISRWADDGSYWSMRNSGLGKQSWPPLNKHETLRLQRGFLRYELCCRVNTIPDRHALWIAVELYGGSRFKPLPNYIHLWEYEEIRCVWAYVRKQYQILVRDIYAEFRCDVRRLSTRARSLHDNEVIVAPDISPDIMEKDYRGSWPLKMSSYGLPLLQQMLRSGFEDQRRLFKNTTSDTPEEIEGFLFLSDPDLLVHQTSQSPRAISPLICEGANPIYRPITLELARRYDIHGILGYDEQLRAEAGLEERGWVFWEDHRRLERFDLSKPPQPHVGFAGETHEIDLGIVYPEEMMHVTKEDHQVLSAKFTPKLPTPELERFFLDRLRVISDQPSQETLSVFQEVCSGMPQAGFPQSSGAAALTRE